MAGPHFDYQIRESARAKYMSLRVTVDRGLEVVVPRGFNRTLITKFLLEKQIWVQSALEKVKQVQDSRPKNPSTDRPTHVTFAAVGRTWAIHYVSKPGRTLRLTEESDGRLVICGPVENLAACHAALRRWTYRQAYSVLIPLLRQLSIETGIAFVQTVIRCQKSRWGSCSSSGTISLNQKLLFVDADLVRYVLIHELCHMREMNHSRHFWKLVSQYYPDWRLARRRLKDAWYQMPHWAG